MSTMYKCIACCVTTSVSHAVDPADVMCSLCLLKLIKAVDKKFEQKEAIFHKEIDRLQQVISQVASDLTPKQPEKPTLKGYM